MRNLKTITTTKVLSQKKKTQQKSYLIMLYQLHGSHVMRKLITKF